PPLAVTHAASGAPRPSGTRPLCRSVKNLSRAVVGRWGEGRSTGGADHRGRRPPVAILASFELVHGTPPTAARDLETEQLVDERVDGRLETRLHLGERRDRAARVRLGALSPPRELHAAR